MIVRQFMAFVVVGTIGFVVDTAVLYAGLALGLGFYGGRVLSYLCAASATWYLNRRYTFHSTSAAVKTEWARFLLLNLLGFVANYGTYVLCLQQHGVFITYPVLAVAAGSLAGLLVNFSVNKYLVFKA